MAQRSPAVKQKDYIQRQYLLRYLQRKRREVSKVAMSWPEQKLITEIIAWVKAEKSRTTRSGGL